MKTLKISIAVIVFVTAVLAQQNNQIQPTERMVNNIWVDVALSSIVRDISLETGAVIAVSPKVPDPLISLDAGMGKPLDQCLNELVAGRGLFIYPQSENLYIISTGDPSCPGFQQVARSDRIYLQYITARHVINSLPVTLRQYLSTGERENEVLVYALPEISNRIVDIISKMDAPRQQVVLEVMVVELLDEASEEFSINWGFDSEHFAGSIEPTLGAFKGATSYTSISGDQALNIFANLKMLVSQEKASIRSRPRVATLNGKKATIDIALEEYFTIATGLLGATASLRTELEVIKSGVLLSMTPNIGNDGNITVNVLTEVSDVVARQNEIAGNTSGDLPIIRRRKAETNVRVKEGDAIVIGGLVETKEFSRDKKVPILGDLPLVGGLFKSNEQKSTQKEVVIFITPRIMENDIELPFASRHQLIRLEEEIKTLKKQEPQAEINEFQELISMASENFNPVLAEADIDFKNPFAGHRKLSPKDITIDQQLNFLNQTVAKIDRDSRPATVSSTGNDARFALNPKQLKQQIEAMKKAAELLRTGV